MKTQKTLKALVLSLAMAMIALLPATMQAQTDGFFRGGENYENRDASINSDTGTGITNLGIGENAPLGSGLLILAAAGAGYAFTKRRRNYRRGATLLLVLAMTLTFTNCKKKVETISNETSNGVQITLNVDGGSKVIVNPTGHTNPNYATVTFEAGDIIYVGNNGHYCGYLQHNGTYFTGYINETNLSTSDYLHFYFMGNKGELSEPSIVSITDQTSKYPVISYGRSTSLYNSGTSSYTAKLQNYCAIAKFTISGVDTDKAITITGMKNTVSVDFSKNGTGDVVNPYTYSKSGSGEIRLHAESNTERWAILLPQDKVTTAKAHALGYIGTNAFTVLEVSANGYYYDEVDVNLVEGSVEGAFAINKYGDQVFFAPGNLRATTSNNGSTWTWSFAEHQYEYIGNATSNTAINGSMTVSTNGTVDLFGWNGNSSSNDNYGIYNNKTSSNYGNVASEALKHDWGHNPITNGGNTADKWRTLTQKEWMYVFNQRGPTSGVRYAKATVNGVSGAIILPDDWNESYYNLMSTNTPSAAFTSNTINLSDWDTKLEENGAVFLPAACRRNGTTVTNVDRGSYWSSTSTSTAGTAYSVYFNSSNVGTVYGDRRNYGLSVRLVRDVD